MQSDAVVYFVRRLFVRKVVRSVPWIYRHIDSLLTPCGEINVTNEAGKRIRFSIKANPFDPDYHLFYGTEKEETLDTDTNYLLCIQTCDLSIGQVYKISLTGSRLSYGDSDEHTEAVSGTANGYSIAIGAYDPNDDEKQGQAYKRSKRSGFLSQGKIELPAKYDESKFVKYDVEMLEDHAGFSFRLLECSVEEIAFPVAWVKHKYKNLPDYEAAVEFWTT